MSHPRHIKNKSPTTTMIELNIVHKSSIILLL
nr:MAG TPA: hypothetical protein [Caudoviricetes sp.]